MDSSFLTGIHIVLGLLACILFLKMIIQFGLPNHPARFVSYLVGLCAFLYFCGLAATDLSLLSPWVWMKWRALPLIAGSLCLLFQTIILVGTFSVIQQKVVSRLPLMAALICFAFFSDYADGFASFFIISGGLFLIISVKKARYQTRLYLKMVLMFLIHVGLNYSSYYLGYVVGQIVLVFFVWYLFIFEHSFGIAAMIDDFRDSVAGES